MIPPESIARMRERMRASGPSNCWTGTSGALAADVNRLLAERERLIKQIAALKVEKALLTEKQTWAGSST